VASLGREETIPKACSSCVGVTKQKNRSSVPNCLTASYQTRSICICVLSLFSVIVIIIAKVFGVAKHQKAYPISESHKYIYGQQYHAPHSPTPFLLTHYSVSLSPRSVDCILCCQKYASSARLPGSQRTPTCCQQFGIAGELVPACPIERPVLNYHDAVRCP
jgi:hypothetical protein